MFNTGFIRQSPISHSKVKYIEEEKSHSHQYHAFDKGIQFQGR